MMLERQPLWVATEHEEEPMGVNRDLTVEYRSKANYCHREAELAASVDGRIRWLELASACLAMVQRIEAQSLHRSRPATQ